MPEVVVVSPSDQAINVTDLNGNDSFAYYSPTLQLVNVPEGIDSSCYGLTVNELTNKSTELCYGIQINEFLKHPTNQSLREQLSKQPMPDEFFDGNLTDHFDQKYTLQFLKKSQHQQLQEIFGARNFTSATYNDTSSHCNPSIYDDMVNPGEPRLYLIHSCITVTGNVTLVHIPSDGDLVFAVALDEPYQILLTTANFNSKMNGRIWVELICQSPNNSKELVHKGDCIAGTSPPVP